MICGMGLDPLQSSVMFTRAVCHSGVGSNSIFCNGCKHWVHKKCSWLKHLAKDPEYRCTWCQETAYPLDNIGKSKLDLTRWRSKLPFATEEVMLSAADGCELPTTTCVKTAWKKFKELLPILFSPHIFFRTRGHVYSSCAVSNVPCQ